MEWRLRLPYERPPLSLNQRLHWAAKARLTKQVRERVAWLCLAEHLPRGLDRIEVLLVVHPKDRRRRDGDNYVATLKPCLDGLVDHGLVPDDNSDHVRFGVVIAGVDRADPRVELVIRPAP